MYTQLLRGWLSAGLLAAFSTACGFTEPLSRSATQVIGGTETGDAHAAVLYVTAEVATFGGSPLVKIGSGTLIAPNLVATALHVVSRNRTDVAFTCDNTGNEMSGSSGSLLGPPVAPEKVAIYAGPAPGDEPIALGIRIVSSGSPTLCQNDIAFVVLDRSLDLPTVRVHRGAPAELGDALTAVGFGDDGSKGRVLRTERPVTVSAVGQWVRTFTVTEGPCLGDSGGPALSIQGELSGVFSTVSVKCTGPSAAAKYTDVSYFSTLVEEAFEAAEAGSPWLLDGLGGGDAGGAAAVEPDAGRGSVGQGSEGATACAIGSNRHPGGPSVTLIALAFLALSRRVRARGRR